MPDNKNPLYSIFKKRPEPTIPFTYGNDMVTFFDSWINSPEYESRLRHNQYENPQQTVSNRSNALGNLNITFDNNTRSVGSAPVSHGSQGRVNINQEELSKLDIPVQTGLAHEISHSIGAKPQWQNPFIGFNKTEEEIIKQSISKQKPSVTGVQDSPERKKTQREFDNWKYLQRPEEIKADLDASRWNMFQKNIYDIRKGDPFTKDHLNRAREEFIDDASFNRLIEQTGEDNFIDLMNTIAFNNTNNNTDMAAYGGKLNPMQYQYFMGGAFDPVSMGANALSGFIPQQNKQGFTSVGGSAASSALKFAGMGASLGPIGAIAGGVVGGGLGMIQGSKQRQEEEAAMKTETDRMQRTQLANMNYGIGQSSNLPMADGGAFNPMNNNMVGDFTSYETGGTHETNPFGGVPQGFNSDGQMRTVEEGETKFKFKDTDYIFSDRLIF